MSEQKYGVYKSIEELSKAEKLRMGGRLLELQDSLISYRDELRRSPDQPDEANVYDVEGRELISSTGGSLQIVAQVQVLSAADSLAYTKEMRDAALERANKLRKFVLSLLEERIVEINETINKL